MRDAFRALGHDAMSADIEPTDVDGPHHQGDVTPLLRHRWDMIIAFPPCTDLASSGARWWATKGDARRDAAVSFVAECWAANSSRVAIENPVGRLSTLWRKPDQIIQPWQYGHPYAKATCLWLRGLPILLPVEIVTPVGSWAWDVNRNPTTRSATFPGIARAMAQQWG